VAYNENRSEAAVLLEYRTKILVKLLLGRGLDYSDLLVAKKLFGDFAKCAAEI